MWITLNEPLQAAHQGYRVGTHAPGKTDAALAAAATHHLFLGHGLALEAMRGALPGGRCRSQSDLSRASAARQLPGGRARAELVPPPDLIEPDDMRAICAPVDFLGLNYYSPHYVRLGDWDDPRQGESPLADHPGVVNYVPPELPRTVMGWIIEPDGLYDTLRALDREAPGLPVYITENGCACDDYVTPEGHVNDVERVDYIHGHLDAAWRAIQDGVNVRGYFHWSLMDNFEWARGYQRRFGLYYVDFGTQRRLPKRSAAVYAGVARTNSLPLGDGVVAERALARAAGRG